MFQLVLLVLNQQLLHVLLFALHPHRVLNLSDLLNLQLLFQRFPLPDQKRRSAPFQHDLLFDALQVSGNKRLLVFVVFALHVFAYVDHVLPSVATQHAPFVTSEQTCQNLLAELLVMLAGQGQCALRTPVLADQVGFQIGACFLQCLKTFPV